MSDNSEYNSTISCIIDDVNTIKKGLSAYRQIINNQNEELSQLRAENERLRAMMQWQPIDTAPRDGTEVLIFGNCGIMVMLFDNGWREKANYMSLKTPPTHWMPLPSEPQIERE